MRSVCVVLSVLVLACGSNSSSGPDGGGGGGGDDGSGDPTGDGGGTGGPRTVKLTLTNRPNNAAPYSFFVAYQDGSAPWTVAPAPSGDTYSFDISAPVYGVAWGCIGNVAGTTTTQLRTVNSAHFAVGERTELAFDVPARCSDRFGDGVTLSGTITNRPITGVLIVQFGGRSTFVGPQNGAFSLQTPAGTRDLVIVHAVSQGNGEYYSDEAVVVRDLAVTAPTTRTIDFSASDSMQYFNVDASVPNFGARIFASTTLYTANGTSLAVTRESQSWESNALAPAQMRTTDVYDQSIAVTTQGASATLTNATNNPDDQSYVAPTPLGAVSSMVATKMPYPIVQTTWTSYANVVGYTWNATQQLAPQQCGGNVACTVVWTSVLSPGVTGATPGYRMPDLSAVAGWKAGFQLVNGAQVVGSVTAQTSSAGAGDFPPGVPANGTKRAFVRSDYAVTP